ncbi:hypothetical protein RND81_14G072400 [Saponaria officinalis]|uniref:Peptidase A1 domain-containing protein n=1 Tax=Saponaria officinalis TaxID=3572 RepID=A0AAW1GPD2_SAPOF
MDNQVSLIYLLIVLQILLFILSGTTSDTKVPNGLSLKMIHIDSPNSPMYQSNLTDEERIKKYVEISTARVKSLARSNAFRNKSMRSPNLNDIVIRPSLTVQNVLYLVQVGIGTFHDEFPTSRTYYLGVDTASTLIWTQCEGCRNCFHQAYPYFPAARSSTYYAFPCSLCPEGAQCQHNGCRFEREYIDNSRVVATVAKEVFTFASEDGRTHSIHDIIFGCGYDMQDFSEGENPNNKFSGFIGMGYGYYGFMSQTQLMLYGRFSYCLQSVFAQGNSSPMYLRFGNDVLPIEGTQTTRMYQYGDNPGYYLSLLDISVDGQRLHIPPAYFAIKNDGSGGCIIDSGTATSWIVTGAYEVVKQAIQRFIGRNNRSLKEKRTAHEGFEFCYKGYNDPSRLHLPTVTFHFENNADFVIDVTEAFIFFNTRAGKVFCMGFKKSTYRLNNGVTYLGVTQQINKRIIYDTMNSVLHFATTDCSEEG